jgi:hypothetical protein
MAAFGTNGTFWNVRCLSAIKGKADIEQRDSEGLIYEHPIDVP